MKSRPKILFISHETDIGGSTVSLVTLIQGLIQLDKIDLKVILPNKEGKASQLLTKYDIHYKKIWYRRNFKLKTEKYSLKFRVFDFLNMIAVRKLQHYIQTENFDIVCSNSTGVDVGARAAKLANVPHIYYAREMMELGLNCEYRNKQRMRDLLEYSEYVIFISKAVEAYYKSNYKLKNSTQFFDGFVLEDYYIKNHNILEKEIISFVQVGAFTNQKGTLNTIEMLYSLNQQGITNWHIEFVGQGTEEYVSKMHAAISKYHLEAQVTIGEFCSDMKKKLASKDILIMNSKSEGFGRVTVEGMLAGCLVIGRYLDGTAEIIEDKINGIAFDKDEDFINEIQRIADEPEPYRQLAKSGQQYAMIKYDCANTAKNFIKVVEECLK